MDGALRLGRGLAVALIVVVVSSALHTAGGGCLDHFSSIGFVLLTLGTLLASVVLSSREWTLPRLTAIVVVAQVCFHGMFEVVEYAGGHTSLIPSTADADLSNSISMLAAHVGAAVVIVAILRCGERWLLAFLRILNSHLSRPAAPVVPPHLAPLLPLQAPKESGLRRILFASLLTHRGPPTSIVALATA